MKASGELKLGPNQEKWLSALESGEYKQTKSALARESKNGKRSFCCLGVACDVSQKSEWEESSFKANGKYKGPFLITYINETESLPASVMRWLSMKDDEGRFSDGPGSGSSCLTEMNDKGASFKKIAKFIRANPTLFFSRSK